MHPLLASDHLAVVDLTGPGHYLRWGIIQVSYANAIVITLMIVAFALALVLPFPPGTLPPPGSPPPAGDDRGPGDEAEAPR
jgi:hypothetical protein